jgi:hypothetical protein
MIKQLKELCRAYNKNKLPTRFLHFGKYYEIKVINNKLYKIKENSFHGIIQSELTKQDLIDHKVELLENYQNFMEYIK